MSGSRPGKPSNKPTRRKRRGSPADQNLDQEQSPKLDQRDEEQAGRINASIDTPVTGVAEPAELAEPALLSAENFAAEVAVLSSDEIVPAAVPSIGVFAHVGDPQISIRNIAAAYANYIKTALQETACFGEKLLSARSVEQAIETQTEFTKRTYAEFLIASQKIFELYGELAKQTSRSWPRAWGKPLSEVGANEALTALS